MIFTPHHRGYLLSRAEEAPAVDNLFFYTLLFPDYFEMKKRGKDWYALIYAQELGGGDRQKVTERVVELSALIDGGNKNTSREDTLADEQTIWTPSTSRYVEPMSKKGHVKIPGSIPLALASELFHFSSSVRDHAARLSETPDGTPFTLPDEFGGWYSVRLAPQR